MQQPPPIPVPDSNEPVLVPSSRPVPTPVAVLVVLDVLHNVSVVVTTIVKKPTPIIFFLGIYLVYFVVLFFVWRGQYWARTVVMILAGLGVITSWDIILASSTNQMIATAIGVLISISWLVVLTRKPIAEYFYQSNRA